MTTIYIKWAWRHYSLDVEEYDSLDDAVSAAYWAQQTGSESFDRIEQITDDGQVTVIDAARFAALSKPLEDAERKEYESARPIVAYIKVDGYILDFAYDLPSAQAEYDRLLPYLGDRLVLDPLPPPASDDQAASGDD